MTTSTNGASRAMFHASVSALPMLRGPAIAYSPEDEAGSGGESNEGVAEADNTTEASQGVEGGEGEGGEEFEDDTGEDDPAAQAEGEGEGEKPKPKKSAKERIAELTWKAKEAERREAEAREREQALLDRLAAKEEKPAEDAGPVVAAEDARPDPNDYEFGVTDPQFVEDLADWKLEQRMKERDAEHTARQKFQAAIDGFHAKARELYPEGEPEGLKAYKALPDAGSPVMQQMVIDSEVGPQLAAHLGENPTEIKRISGLHPLLQAREIGKLEATLKAPAKPAPKTVSDAPPPPSHQARGAGGKFTVAPDTDDFAAFEAAYK